MSFQTLEYYHSYRGNDSAMGFYCTDLADGGIFVAQAIQGGVDYIIRKDNVQREFKVLMTDNKRDCIGIRGVRIGSNEALFLLMKERAATGNQKSQCYIMSISIPSSSDIKEESLSFPRSRLVLYFAPTLMKVIRIEEENLTYLLLGKPNGSVDAYTYQSNAVSRPFSPSNEFSDFFPRSSYPVLSIDFCPITESHRIWAVGYANGLVCIYSLVGVTFTEKLKMKPCVHEFGPLCENQCLSEKERRGQKFVFVTYQSSPVYEVRILTPFGRGDTGLDLRVDLLTTCYDGVLLRYVDVWSRGLMNPVPLCDLKDVSYVNCLEVIPQEDGQSQSLRIQRLIVGDCGNKVHVYQFHPTSDNAGYGMTKERTLELNDCIYGTRVIQNRLVVSTRRGIYVFVLGVCLRFNENVQSNPCWHCNKPRL